MILIWFFYNISRMFQLPQFGWTLRSSVWDVFNNFLHIDATDRSKISSDQKPLFIALSLYPLSFFANTPFKWPELKGLIQLNRGLTFLHLGMLIHITQPFFSLEKKKNPDECTETDYTAGCISSIFQTLRIFSKIQHQVAKI